MDALLQDVRTEVRSLRDADSATQAGSVLGTPAFMAPEQAGGEIDKVDERADVFGLGAVLCTILTGKPPYVGPNAEAIGLMAIRSQTADAFARLDGCGADSELVALCKHCLAADPDARPRNAGEVATAVAGHLSATVERAVYTRATLETDEENPEVAAGAFDLLRVFQQILARRKEEVLMEIEREEVSMAEMIERLRNMIFSSGELNLRDFFERAGSRRELVLAFLSVLELVRTTEIKLFQRQTFGDIIARVSA